MSDNIDEIGGAERFERRRGPGRPRLPPARKITIRIDEILMPVAEKGALEERRTVPAFVRRLVEDALEDMQMRDDEENATDD